MKLSVFLLLLLLSSASTYKNLALRGKATQSMRYEHALSAASNAIDGNHDSLYPHGSCSHSAQQNNPWWRVDLLESYIITSIIITNRGDCCEHFINGLRIHIGNSLVRNGLQNPACAVITRISPGAVAEFSCNGMDGRYVNIVIPDREEFLTLCEVEVYGSRLD
uniref:Fucolectin tachylectin-4 pentraxin-1 domain-containing protein n=1 Tax=Stegastes partitus TaxID=144197 RepID=A0A3B5B1Z7_9TELE